VLRAVAVNWCDEPKNGGLHLEAYTSRCYKAGLSITIRTRVSEEVIHRRMLLWCSCNFKLIVERGAQMWGAISPRGDYVSARWRPIFMAPHNW
jgi:hypothetical protein